ncbi:MAG: formate dehydrogenase subunit gamma [bacterium JZ-2024 1]
MTYKRITDGEYVRFSLAHRWLHNTLAVSFVALAYTGFGLRFSESWWALPFLKIPAGPDLRGWLHRLFGIILAVNFAIQIVLLMVTKEGREELKALYFGRNDLRDILMNLAHWFGIVPEGPRSGRYTYIEKAEYWALVWGSIVMIVTGFFMWSETWALRHFPGWVYDVSRMIHFYEAVLATLAIGVWHFYWVIFDPEVYPYSEAMITGKVSLEYLKHHHPLEYEAALRDAMSARDDAPPMAHPEGTVPSAMSHGDGTAPAVRVLENRDDPGPLTS